jgi:hypothetical protein
VVVAQGGSLATCPGGWVRRPRPGPTWYYTLPLLWTRREASPTGAGSFVPGRTGNDVPWPPRQPRGEAFFRRARVCQRESATSDTQPSRRVHICVEPCSEPPSEGNPPGQEVGGAPAFPFEPTATRPPSPAQRGAFCGGGTEQPLPAWPTTVGGSRPGKVVCRHPHPGPIGHYIPLCWLTRS